MPSFIAATEPLPAAQTIERNVRGFFSFFSCSYKKRTRFSFTKEKICRFLPDEKTTKRVAETLSRTLNLLLGSAYTRLPTDGTAHLRALSEHELESNLYPFKA